MTLPLSPIQKGKCGGLVDPLPARGDAHEQHVAAMIRRPRTTWRTGLPSRFHHHACWSARPLPQRGWPLIGRPRTAPEVSTGPNRPDVQPGQIPSFRSRDTKGAGRRSMTWSGRTTASCGTSIRTSIGSDLGVMARSNQPSPEHRELTPRKGSRRSSMRVGSPDTGYALEKSLRRHDITLIDLRLRSRRAAEHRAIHRCKEIFETIE